MKEYVVYKTKGAITEQDRREILEKVRKGVYIDSRVKAMTIYRSTSDNITIERLREEFRK